MYKSCGAGSICATQHHSSKIASFLARVSSWGDQTGGKRLWSDKGNSYGAIFATMVKPCKEFYKQAMKIRAAGGSFLIKKAFFSFRRWDEDGSFWVHFPPSKPATNSGQHISSKPNSYIQSLTSDEVGRRCRCGRARSLQIVDTSALTGERICVQGWPLQKLWRASPDSRYAAPFSG